MRSSWLASAKNRRICSWLASRSCRPVSRSCRPVSIRASMPFSAAPSLPTSLRGLCGVTRSVRSPAVIRSAWPAIASIGRRPRRSTTKTPRPISSTTAMEPVVTMTSTLSMVVATWSRLVPATRDPPAARSDWTRIRFLPPGPIRVCGPGLVATLAALGDRNQDTAQHGADPGGQFLQAERLGHVVVPADREPGDLVVLGVPGGQEDHRDPVALPARPADDLEPVDVGSITSRMSRSYDRARITARPAAARAARGGHRGGPAGRRRADRRLVREVAAAAGGGHGGAAAHGDHGRGRLPGPHLVGRDARRGVPGDGYDVYPSAPSATGSAAGSGSRR